MQPLNRDEIVLFDEPGLTPAAARRLLVFYQAYHRRNLAFFLAVRRRWHDLHRGQQFPGLCANIHPLTGQLRPDAEQFLWGWGDARALGVWCSFFNLSEVPDVEEQVTLADGSTYRVHLHPELADYVEVIYAGLKDRLSRNAGVIPFRADRASGLPTEQDATPGGGAGGFPFANLFAVSGFVQYGLWRRDAEAVTTGLRLLRECQQEIASQGDSGVTRHGPRMITLGVIGEGLKGLARLGAGPSLPGAVGAAPESEAFAQLRADLLAPAAGYVGYILANHYREEPTAFWEVGTGTGTPQPDSTGAILVDPGHATECAGFLAELVPFLRENWPEVADEALRAALNIHLFADRIGFLPSGAMTKYADLVTGEPLPDTQARAAEGRVTAPWWNVREHCAAALRLYTLTQDSRLIETFRRGQHASYLLYPNRLLNHQMIQTVDVASREPLDVAPATGNLDPMHDPRARIREMEYLRVLAGG